MATVRLIWSAKTLLSFSVSDAGAFLLLLKCIARTVMHKFAFYIGDAQSFLARRVTARILDVF